MKKRCVYGCGVGLACVAALVGLVVQSGHRTGTGMQTETLDQCHHNANYPYLGFLPQFPEPVQHHVEWYWAYSNLSCDSHDWFKRPTQINYSIFAKECIPNADEIEMSRAPEFYIPSYWIEVKVALWTSQNYLAGRTKADQDTFAERQSRLLKQLYLPAVLRECASQGCVQLTNNGVSIPVIIGPMTVPVYYTNDTFHLYNNETEPFQHLFYNWYVQYYEYRMHGVRISPEQAPDFIRNAWIQHYRAKRDRRQISGDTVGFDHSAWKTAMAYLAVFHPIQFHRGPFNESTFVATFGYPLNYENDHLYTHPPGIQGLGRHAGQDITFHLDVTWNFKRWNESLLRQQHSWAYQCLVHYYAILHDLESQLLSAYAGIPWDAVITHEQQRAVNRYGPLGPRTRHTKEAIYPSEIDFCCRGYYLVLVEFLPRAWITPLGVVYFSKHVENNRSPHGWLNNSIVYQLQDVLFSRVVDVFQMISMGNIHFAGYRAMLYRLAYNPRTGQRYHVSGDKQQRVRDQMARSFDVKFDIFSFLH